MPSQNDGLLAGLRKIAARFRSIQLDGVPGAYGASRWVGTVAGTPPTKGTFRKGDWVTDTTLGGMWMCTATPNTWTYVQGGYPLYSGAYLIVPNFANGVSGVWNTNAPVIGTLFAVPVQVPAGSASIKTLGYNTSTGGTSSTVYMGLYSDNGSGYPGTLIGSVTLAVTGFSRLTGTLASPDTGPWPALRWVAFLATGTTAPTCYGPTVNTILQNPAYVMSTASSNVPWAAAYTLTSQSSLPSPFTSGAAQVAANGTSSNVPAMVLGS